MDEKEIANAISEGLIEHFEDDDFNLNSYEEEGFLTTDKGLVLKFKEGDEFQITIKQTAFANNE